MENPNEVILLVIIGIASIRLDYILEHMEKSLATLATRYTMGKNPTYRPVYPKRKPFRMAYRKNSVRGAILRVKRTPKRSILRRYFLSV